MISKFIKITFMIFTILISYTSNAGLIKSDNYNLTNIEGDFIYGNTNWAYEPTLYVDNNKDISIVDNILSNGYFYSPRNFYFINGIYNFSDDKTWLTFTFNKSFNYDIDTIGFIVSRNNSLKTMVEVQTFQNQNWEQLFQGTTKSIGLGNRFSNNSFKTYQAKLELPEFNSNTLRIGFHGDQVGLHEIYFKGKKREEALEVSEPSMFYIFLAAILFFSLKKRKFLLK